MVHDLSGLRYYITTKNGLIISKLVPTQREYEGYTEVSKELYDSLTEFPYTYDVDADGELINIEHQPTEPAPSHGTPTEELENEVQRLEAENALLKAQNKALADRTDFHEDVLTENHPNIALMIVRFLIQILIKLLGDDRMMALLLTQRVILNTKGFTFEDVPEVLKPQVYEYLEESGVEFLAGDYVPPTGE